MAVDTREKRQSAGCFMMPWLPVGVDPGPQDQAERQAAAWVYSGILALSLSVVRFTAEAVALASFADEAIALSAFTSEVVALGSFDDEDLEN